MTQVKAIIFDCFGVLIQDSYVSFWLRHFAGNKEKMDAAKHADALANKKVISDEELIQQFAHLAGISEDECRKEVEFGNVNDEMFALIAKLKPDYKIGFLSNANDNYLDTLFTPQQLANFDAFSISSESGFIKPEAGAYEDIAAKLGVRLDECLFIDDRADFCEAARHVGMQAAHFTELDRLKIDLQEAGVIHA